MALKEISGFVRRFWETQSRQKQPINPYTFGVPVRGADQFFGREEELQLVFDTLKNVPRGQKQDMVVLGPRRIGKSSLLYRLLDLLQDDADFVPVYIDVQQIKPREMRPLFLKMLRSIQKGFQHKNLMGHLPDFDTLKPQQPDEDVAYLDFSDDMQRLNETIQHNNLPRLVLMFDEVELLLDFGGRDTLDWFRSLIQSMPYCIFIVAGSDQLYAMTQDYGSPFYNIFKSVELFPLTTAAARALLEKPMAQIGYSIAPAQTNRILQATGNTPYFIQGIGHYLVAEMIRQKRLVADELLVSSVISESVTYLSAQFNYLWNIVSRTQQIILYGLMKTGKAQTINDLMSQLPYITPSLVSKQPLEIFDDLEQRQILIQVSTNCYWFVIPLFANWIQDYVDDSEIIRLASIVPGQMANSELDRIKLREILIQYFSLGELQTLYFDLGIDYEALVGNTKAEKARELIEYLERRDRLSELLKLIHQERPDIDLS